MPFAATPPPPPHTRDQTSEALDLAFPLFMPLRLRAFLVTVALPFPVCFVTAAKSQDILLHGHFGAPTSFPNQSRFLLWSDWVSPPKLAFFFSLREPSFFPFSPFFNLSIYLSPLPPFFFFVVRDVVSLRHLLAPFLFPLFFFFLLPLS